MITGKENLLTIAADYPQLVAELTKHGMGHYFKADILGKIGRFTRLNTLLKASGLDVQQFLQSYGVNEKDVTMKAPAVSESLHLLAMLPCGLRNPFKEMLEDHLFSNPEQYAGLNYLAEGNVNHEQSYYPLLDQVESVDGLPDIMIASDVNNFFHRPFIDRFLSKGAFEAVVPYVPNDYLARVGYPDPDGRYTMLTTNMLVMAVDRQRLGNRPMPQRWSDLLSPEFDNEIIMRGRETFCNAVMLPFYKDGGMEAIRLLAGNIKSGKHPAEMVKLAGSDDEEGAAVYIMPYFFAQKIQNPNVTVVWPQDGAIASPVFMLVKRGVASQYQALLGFLQSEKVGQMLVKRFFPSMHPNVSHASFPESVKWLGWDFLNHNNIGELKSQIRAESVRIRASKLRPL